MHGHVDPQIGVYAVGQAAQNDVGQPTHGVGLEGRLGTHAMDLDVGLGQHRARRRCLLAVRTEDELKRAEKERDEWKQATGDLEAKLAHAEEEVAAVRASFRQVAEGVSNATVEGLDEEHRDGGASERARSGGARAVALSPPRLR